METIMKTIKSFLCMSILFAPIVSMAGVYDMACYYNKTATLVDGLKDTKEQIVRYRVDVENSKAWIIVDGSKVATLSIISTGKHITLIEITDYRNVMMTTFSFTTLQVVHSRNSVWKGRLIPSQLYGFCDVSNFRG